MYWATLNVIFALGTVGALILGVIAFMRAHPDATPQQFDENTAARLAELQLNRDFMARLETAYQQQNTVFQGAFNTLTEFVKLVAPLTPIKSDDELSKFLGDVKTPGDPAAPIPPSVG